jgi:hypothetical protein
VKPKGKKEKVTDNLADKEDYYHSTLEGIKTAYKQIINAEQRKAKPSTDTDDWPMQAADVMNLFEKPGPLFAFKKGISTGWTWGTVYSISTNRFIVKCEKKGRWASDVGDCGSIFFSKHSLIVFHDVY